MLHQIENSDQQSCDSVTCHASQKNMPPRKKTHGVGAVVSSLIKFLHPSALIREKFPNPVHGQWLEGCQTVRQEVKTINRKDQLSLVVTHHDFKDGNGDLQELHAVKKHFAIQEEGDSDYFFDVSQEAEQQQQADLLPAVIDSEIQGENHGGTSDLLTALSGVVDIDDDNEPAPENVPTTATTSSVLSNEWGHMGICLRKQQSIANTQAKLVYPVDTMRDDINLQLFERLFPKQFIENIMIPTMNWKLKNAVTYSEFLVWIGLWILMSTVDGSDRRGFWSNKDINIYEGAPFRLTSFMSRNHFEEILNCISYTSNNPPETLDRFWEVRELIDAWNKNMGEMFIPSWINTIDESMSKWLNEYTCPGFMCVPRKPWRFGNEYHDAGCALSDIIWQVDLREGKDCPRHLGEKTHDEKGKTIGVLLHLTEPVWGTGKLVVLDSGFCVLQGLVELKKKGVYAHALIKK